MKLYKLKKKITIICIIVIIIIAAGIWTFFNTDLFRTKRSAFYRYFTTSGEALNIINTDDFSAYNKMKETKPYVRKAEMKIQSSSNIADSNILDKIKFSMTEKTDYKNEKSNAEISIKSSNNELANISCIREKNIYGAYCPLVSNGYVCIKNENLKQLASNISLKNDGTILGTVIESLGIDSSKFITEEIQNIKLDKLLETTKVQKNHIESYYKLIKDEAPNSAYSKKNNDKIKIEDNSYKVNSYTLELNKKESANIETDLLEKLSQDSIMMDYITSKFKLLNLNEDYTDINKLNAKIESEISNIKNNNENAKELTITVCEYKQKNIQTSIKFGDDTIIINHLKDDKSETSIITLNNTSIKYKKENNQYTIKVSTINNEEITKSIEVVYNQTGTINGNDIKNIMNITLTNGIKVITFAYNDQVTFSDDVGTIKGFSGSTIAILNEFAPTKVNTFLTNLKQKINQVYVNKGSTIGINLDPIFE